MSAPVGIRIGTAERDAAISALGEHMVAGRLEPDEYGDRVAAASVARTRPDLDALFVDLPAPHAFPEQLLPAQRGYRAWERRVPRSVAARLIVLALILVAFTVSLPFLLIGAALWFVVLPLLGLGGPRHRGHGPRPRGWRY